MWATVESYVILLYLILDENCLKNFWKYFVIRFIFNRRKSCTVPTLMSRFFLIIEWKQSRTGYPRASRFKGPKINASLLFDWSRNYFSIFCWGHHYICMISKCLFKVTKSIFRLHCCRMLKDCLLDRNIFWHCTKTLVQV